MSGSLSVRERVLQHIETRFKSRVTDDAIGKVGWDQVVRTPIPANLNGFNSAVGIFDTTEIKKPMVSHQMCALTVITEFAEKARLGDNPSTRLNALLADVQRTMREDIYCGGLTLNVEEVRNEIDVEGAASQLLSGMVEWTVTYRHRASDPFTQT